MSANEDGAWPSTPPTSPGPAAAAVKRPVWPTVLGVIAIVFGALGAIQGGLAALMPVLMSRFESAFPAGMQFTDATRRWAPWTITLSLLLAALALLLLAGGIGLLQRRQWARTVLGCWAPLKIIFVVANGALSWMVQRDMQSSVMSSVTAGFPSTPAGTATPAAFASFQTAFALLTVAFLVLWGWALPIFVLIWFSRQSIKAQAAQWVTDN